MSRKNLIVGQSGGPTAVINSSLYGVVSEGMRHPETIEHVYGMINGIEGFLNGTVLDFAEALPGEKLDGLKVTPGAYLGSCRYKLPESQELVLDFTGLEYISSAGLRVILKMQKFMNVKGTMKLIHVSDIIQDVFDITGFADILSIE